LKEDKDRPPKQRHTVTRIAQRLKKEHGYTGGFSTVCRYVREAKLRTGIGQLRAFIPLEIDNTGEAEVDWGTAHVILNGVQTKIKFFCIGSKYSGKHFVRLYPCERQQAFFDAHVKAFSYFGGVFPVLIYDNLTTAVHKVLKGKKRIEQESFSKFHAYYNFKPRFCNVAAGHEKGGVEGIVGFSRRNYMVPVPEAQSLVELNETILTECLAYGNHRIKNRPGKVDELFAQEEGKLTSLPPECVSFFLNTRRAAASANAFSFRFSSCLNALFFRFSSCSVSLAFFAYSRSGLFLQPEMQSFFHSLGLA